jgi:hypothetical protein
VARRHASKAAPRWNKTPDAAVDQAKKAHGGNPGQGGHPFPGDQAPDLSKVPYRGLTNNADQLITFTLSNLQYWMVRGRINGARDGSAPEMQGKSHCIRAKKALNNGKKDDF